VLKLGSSPYQGKGDDVSSEGIMRQTEMELREETGY
jgi:hypothetical protein